jgi:hypothetical protein
VTEIESKKPTPKWVLNLALGTGLFLGGVSTGRVADELLEPSSPPNTVSNGDTSFLFSPPDAPIIEGSALAKNAKFALQRELVVSSGDEFLGTGGLVTCNGIFLIGKHTGIRAVAHLDLMHDGHQMDQQITNERVSQLIQLFHPDEPVCVYIKEGTWDLGRHVLKGAGAVNAETAESNFTEILKNNLMKALHKYPNVSIIGASPLSSREVLANGCGIDSKGLLYETENLVFDPQITPERNAAKSVRVKTNDSGLLVAFDGRSEGLKNEVERAWKERGLGR